MSLELKQARPRRPQDRHKFDNENNSFARFTRAFFIFDILQTLSFFPRHEMTCFAVVWRTLADDDKVSILSYLWSASFNLIPG